MRRMRIAPRLLRPLPSSRADSRLVLPRALVDTCTVSTSLTKRLPSNSLCMRERGRRARARRRVPSPPGSEEPVWGHPSGSRGTRRCAFYPSRARHRAPLHPCGWPGEPPRV
eukprot:scaffold24306_cov59-Phaeocystis_antarctica.AAC.2